MGKFLASCDEFSLAIRCSRRSSSLETLWGSAVGCGKAFEWFSTYCPQGCRIVLLFNVRHSDFKRSLALRGW